MELGPNNVIIKTGEHGAMLFGKGIMNFLEPGPILSKPSKIRPGAGDCFVGGIAGFIACSGKNSPSFEDLKASIARGTVMASFNCESFSVESLVDLTQDEVSERLEKFFKYTSF